MDSNKRFNIRVYGLLIANNQVLVSDEFLFGRWVTKFPGGGLEWGEGINQCLIREFKEELSVEIQPQELFYINDFFQQSFIDKSHQIISIYYRVNCINPVQILTQQTAHNHLEMTHGSQVFRWIKLSTINPQDFYFPIDKVVAKLLNEM